MVLDRRKRDILQAVLHCYIFTAEPVSSGILAKKYELGVSPATVRHELALLEEMGYLKQPHTSAGRIPTDKAYRYYVDNLMGVSLSFKEEEVIHCLYAALNKEIEDLMWETSRLLSRLTRYMAIVLAPALSKSSFKHIDLVSLSSNIVLMVLITDTGWVEKRVLEFGNDIDYTQLATVERKLNQLLHDLDLEDIKLKGQELERLMREDRMLVRKIVAQIIDCLEREESERIFLGGTASMLQQPEFESIGKVQFLLEALEHRYLLLHLLKEVMSANGVMVKIGTENEHKEMKDYSFVGANYQLGGRNVGTLGILGPTRMDYARAISTVKCIAKSLSEVLESLHH